jgi:tetratricopeptide (TPR) repeat protein
MIKTKKLLLLSLLLTAQKPDLSAQASANTSAQLNRRAVDSLIIILKTSIEDSNKVELLHKIGSGLYLIKEYKQAIQYETSSVLLANKLNLKKAQSRAYSYLGNIYRDMGDYTEALKNHFASLKIKEETGDKQGAANSYNNIGIIYRWQGNYPAALKNYFTSLKIKEEIGDQPGIASSYHNIGNIYRDQNNYPEALKNYFISLKIKEKNGDKAAMISSYYVIASTYGMQDNYTEALKNNLAALKISKEIGDKEGIADAYGIIGNMYNNQGSDSEALKNYFTAIKICEEIGDKNGMGISYNNIATIYLSQGKIESDTSRKKMLFNEALKYQLADFKIAEELGDKEGMGTGYNNMGSIYGHSGNDTEALKNLFAGLEIRKETGNKRQIAGSYRTIGLLYTHLKKYSEAEQFLNNSLSLYKEIGWKEYIRSCYEDLEKLDSTTGNWEGAYRNHKLSILYRDSIVNDENTKKTVQLQMQYEFDKKEDSLKYQQTLIDEKLKQQTLLTQQQQQSLLLKENQLTLSNKEKKLQHLAFLNTETELQVAQSQRKEKEKQLIIADKEKLLQANRLKLQQTQLNLKENQLQLQRKQQLFYAAAFTLTLLLFLFIYRNIKNRQKANAVISSERLKAEKAALGHKMIELELQSLRAQLNPHFMFNSLNAIQELILIEDNERSHIYLSAFSDLLRTLLDNADQPFISLEKEIGFLELYLSLENLRIPNLDYSIEIDPDIKTEKTRIPNMMLQPYIENAIWHGLLHKKDNRKLKIRIGLKHNSIIFQIEDNGVGRKKAAELKSRYRKQHRSKGMELLSKRFNLLSKEYATEVQTTVTDLYHNGDARGTLVKIIIPSSLSEKAGGPLYGTYNHN